MRYLMSSLTCCIPTKLSFSLHTCMVIVKEISNCMRLKKTKVREKYITFPTLFTNFVLRHQSNGRKRNSSEN